MTVNPIKPNEIGSAKLKYLPDYVIETWNNLIAVKWNGRDSATILKDEAISKLIETAFIAGLAPEILSRKHIIDYGWLDIEDIYREVGWKVDYIAPDYTENFPSYFKFRKDKNKPQ